MNKPIAILKDYLNDTLKIGIEAKLWKSQNSLPIFLIDQFDRNSSCFAKVAWMLERGRGKGSKIYKRAV